MSCFTGVGLNSARRQIHAVAGCLGPAVQSTLFKLNPTTQIASQYRSDATSE